MCIYVLPAIEVTCTSFIASSCDKAMVKDSAFRSKLRAVQSMARLLAEMLMCNRGSKKVWFYAQNTAGSYLYQGVASSNTYTEGAWNHIAICYNNANNNYQLFFNGFYANTTTSLNSIISPNFGSELTKWGFGVLLISGTEANMGGGGMYVDAVRVSKTVRYSNSTYTIPTTYYPVDNYTYYVNFFEGANTSVSMANAEYYFG